MGAFLLTSALGIGALQAQEVTDKGAYLTAAGGCYGCHTDIKNKGVPFAGGRPLETPFGVFYTPNITPDPETGIGQSRGILRPFEVAVHPEQAACGFAQHRA